MNRNVTTTLPVASLLAVVGFAACSGPNGVPEPSRGTSPSLPSSPSSDVAMTAPLAVRTIAPNTTTVLEVQVPPEAVCALHEAGATPSSPHITLFADDSGIVRIHTTPVVDTNGPTRVELQCRTPNQALSIHPVEVRVAANATEAAAAATPPLQRVAAPESPVRAALAAPMAHSQKELIAGGYPIRPDPARAPARYADWLRRVSRPATAVAIRAVPMPESAHDGPMVSLQTTSGNWSGFIAFPFNPPFGSGKLTQVEGQWRIPAVLADPNLAGTTLAAIWVGIDGTDNRKTALIQAGTEEGTIASSCCHFRSYSAWFEYFPNPNVALVGRNLVLANPGDTVYVTVYPGDSSGNLDVNGGSGCFYFENDSSDSIQINHTFASFCQPIPAGSVYSGGNAEWIVERPSFSVTDSRTYPLAHYDSFTLYGAHALDTDGNWNDYLSMTEPGGIGPEQVVMQNGTGTDLSIAFANNSDSMDFMWFASQ